MSADTLPYTLLIILAEFTIGGLLYIAMTLVLAGEVMAKGLLFVTAVPT